MGSRATSRHGLSSQLMSEHQPPFEYHRDDTHRRLRVIAHRALRPEDFLAISQRQVAEGAWTYGVVYDLRGVGGLTTSPNQPNLIAEHVREQTDRHGKRGPVAVVTPPSNAFGIAKGYAYFARHQGFLVEAFCDMSEAEEWLSAQQGQGNA